MIVVSSSPTHKSRSPLYWCYYRITIRTQVLRLISIFAESPLTHNETANTSAVAVKLFSLNRKETDLRKKCRKGLKLGSQCSDFPLLRRGVLVIYLAIKLSFWMGGKVGLTFHLERPAKQFHKQELTFFAWRGSFQYKRHQDKTEPDSTQKMTICYLGCNFLIWTWVKNFSFRNTYLKIKQDQDIQIFW